jgi:teichoic acid transport system ATP-binding protein
MTHATPDSSPAGSAAAPLPALDVENLSISYEVRLDAPTPLGDIKRMIRRQTEHRRLIRAVNDVSFTVERGTTLAIIGRNGAGKSTLLRGLAGVLPPDSGRITVRGRVNLLAIGLGMNDGLTGRENIKLGGLAVGLSLERIEEITDEVAEFAALEEYIDFPMKMYSTGMRSRLAFAVACYLDPEILLIDEALGGGDTAFGESAREKMAELCGQGRTIILVTHGLSSVRSMATDALWLHKGKVAEAGDPEDIIASYMRYCRLEQLDALPDEL